MSLPLALTAVAFTGPWARCTHGSVVGDRVAIAVLCVLGMFTLLGAMTIGILVLPATLLGAVAVASTPRAAR